jgi:hypothetical protein
MQEDTEKSHTLSLHQTTRNSSIMGFRRGKQIYTEDSSSYKNPTRAQGHEDTQVQKSNNSKRGATKGRRTMQNKGIHFKCITFFDI